MASILSVGVAVMDFIMNVEEMPRRAEKYRTHDATMVGGGCAANAAVAVSRLGGRSALATRLGQDLLGDMIQRDLDNEQVQCDRIKQFENCQSSFSSIFIDPAGERQIVNFRDQNLPADADWLIDNIDGFDAYLADTRWPSGAVAAMHAARRQQAPGIIDAESPFNDEVEKAMLAASHIFFSAEGLRHFCHTDNLVEGLCQVYRRYSATVGVTDGANGVICCDDESCWRMSAFTVDALDTLGAGDVWHGALALALGEQQSIKDSLAFASAAAAIKCSRKGGRSGAPARTEVDVFLRNHSVQIERINIK